MICWYNSKCRKETNNCQSNCLRFNNMKILVDNSGLPIDLQYPKILEPEQIDKRAFEMLGQLKKNIELFVRKGDCLYLWSSKCGNGKTTWASKLLMSYFNRIWPYSQLKCRGVYIYTPTLLNSLKTQFISDKSPIELVDNIKKAYNLGINEYKEFKKDILLKGQEAINYGRENNLLIVVLAGRPYHIDKEINHGIDRMMNSLKLVILTEDSIPLDHDNIAVNVLNQWTYQARLFNAAKYVAKNNDMQLVQLVSFGCGTDAITADEIKRILEENKKIYTQLKIDETNNLGAAKIRIRSMVEAIRNRW